MPARLGCLSDPFQGRQQSEAHSRSVVGLSQAAGLHKNRKRCHSIASRKKKIEGVGGFRTTCIGEWVAS